VHRLHLHRARPRVWIALSAAVALAALGVVWADGAISAEPKALRPAPAPATLASLAGATRGAAARGATLRPGPRGAHWIAAWAASPQAPIGNSFAEAGFRDQTIREVVFASAAGSRVRVRLSNAYGSRPLEVGRASVAIQRDGASLVPGSARALTFGGRSSVLIPPRAGIVSDPVSLTIAAESRLAVSLFVPGATGPATQHAEAREITYVGGGDSALALSGEHFAPQSVSWYFLAGLDVLAPARELGTVVTFGDSITDGVGSPIGADARWPNDLARRLAALGGHTLAVVDEGIGGNRVLNDTPCCGAGAVARFGRDVAEAPGARDVVLLEGINDINSPRKSGRLSAPHVAVSALQIVDGYEQIIALAHAAGLRIFGATLTPFQGSQYWTPGAEAERESVNRWIRTSHAFAGVIDFAKALADPGHPLRMAPALDSGDHLHPNGAGDRAMAAAVNLRMLLR
jgi:lysophospholipase L1-like esterase